ncbi:hypothetical protein GCM10010339_29700 [Streptomyces alanosinicus]|uniref:Uncharacterized protein n=1 Tax=Streptomyces alanosinicus TaxID=68171 RepID=A0A919D2T2_9ACTN|nr:hypothetical protein GCM10010339_29700 [Streptomyces alanosinicus]
MRETVIPLVVLAGGTTAMGAYGSYQLNKAAGATLDTGGAIQLGVCVPSARAPCRARSVAADHCCGR